MNEHIADTTRGRGYGFVCESYLAGSAVAYKTRGGWANQNVAIVCIGRVLGLDNNVRLGGGASGDVEGAIK